MREFVLCVQAHDDQWNEHALLLPFEGATDVHVTQHPN